MDLNEPAGLIPDRVFAAPARTEFENTRNIPDSIFLDLAHDAASLPIGLNIHGYRIEGLIGSGGFAVVYRGREMSSQQTVALRFRTAPSSEEEVWREAEIWSRVVHPNVVRCLAARATTHGVMLVLEFMKGESLRQRLWHRGPMQWKKGLLLMLEVMSGLEALWSLGATHRDVTPSNILFDELSSDARAKLTDLGLARGADGTGLHKVGTIGYAAPEQLHASGADAPSSEYLKADLFGLAATMHRALTGVAPFRGKNWNEYLASVRAQTFESPRVRPPPRVLAFVRSFLSPNPAARPSPEDLRRGVAQLLMNNP